MGDVTGIGADDNGAVKGAADGADAPCGFGFSPGPLASPSAV